MSIQSVDPGNIETMRLAEIEAGAHEDIAWGNAFGRHEQIQERQAYKPASW